MVEDRLSVIITHPGGGLERRGNQPMSTQSQSFEPDAHGEVEPHVSFWQERWVQNGLPIVTSLLIQRETGLETTGEKPSSGSRRTWRNTMGFRRGSKIGPDGSSLFHLWADGQSDPSPW